MNLSENLSELLDASQLEAVTYNEGPLLVIAGAGSGKTRVLTYKIAYLISQGCSPYNILALTFTNKAAREMNERIARITENTDIRLLWSGTFHSIFSRILRREADRIGFTPDFTIYDTADSKSLLKTIIKERGLDEKNYKSGVIASKISDAKNRLLLPDFYAEQSDLRLRDKQDNVGETYKIYAEYVKRCRMSNAMDFDDLLLYTFLLLRDNADVQTKYKERFRHILVDEYQDTNYLQHQIVQLLTNPNSRLCVVGDDAQSIYGFRGANIDNILEFQSAYPTAKLVKLECNYRSTQNIVNAANSLISKNRRQIPKVAFSNNEEGEKLHFIELHSDREEAERLVLEIKKFRIKDGISYNDMAVLYRTNAQSRVIEEALRNNAVPYRIYGGLSFYQRKEIKDCIAYFRLVCNPNDEEAFKRIINYPTRGIGATTIKKMQSAALNSGHSLWQVLSSTQDYPECNFTKGTQAKLDTFRLMIEGFREKADTESAYVIATHIINFCGISAELAEDKTPEGISKKENVEELTNSIKEFEQERLEEYGLQRVALSDFLGQVSLLTDADQKDDNEAKVTLMTIHSAKGLEFDTVFITGLEDNLFPNSTARFIPREMEEERRLFYVAITRAKRNCYLSAAKSRFKYGQMEFSEVSPFVREIDTRFIENNNAQKSLFGNASSLREESSADKSYAKLTQTQQYQRPMQHPLFTRGTSELIINGKRFSKVKPSQTATSSSNVQNASIHNALQVGMTIEHERFGIGKVLQMEGSGEDARAIVEFENSGTKKLLLKFARYSIL